MSWNPITASLADPDQLERLYRKDPEEFIRNFETAIAVHPKSQVLQFWRARLRYRLREQSRSRDSMLRYLRLLLVVCGATYLLVRLPDLLPLDSFWYLSRFAPLLVMLAVAAFVARLDSQPLRQLILPGAGFLILALLLALLPDAADSDTVVMALLHAPPLAWCLLGFVYVQGDWRALTGRMDYLRFNGELFILTTLILLGGAVLSAFSISLFGLLQLDIAQWYARNIAVLGLVSAPVVATFLYRIVLQRQSRFAGLIANVFTPLFLILVLSYLAVMVLAQRSPYSDREFLIVFNGLLLLVLAMTLFSIADRDPDRPSRLTDWINKCLVAVTLAVDLVALSAMIYRLYEFGLTPNRLVVTGVNLLIFLHLLSIILAYCLRGRTGGPRLGLNQAALGYLPVYGLWALFVLLLLPLLFDYQ